MPALGGLLAAACGGAPADVGREVAPAAELRGHAPAPPPPSPHPALEAFAARLEADVSSDSVGSIAAAVVADGRVVWEGAFGAADAAEGRAATPATIYRIGSLTKTMTALTLMRLVEAGVVSLDDTVAAYVPEVARLAGRRRDAPPITLRALASHTAGLEREPSSSLAARGRRGRWDRKVLSSIPLTEARSDPGERYLYSNIGYAILGLAMERAAGAPFEDLVRDLVLEPIGMRSTSFAVPEGERERLAAGYVNLPDGTVDPRVPRAEHRGRGYKVPSEGLYSTTGDLARLILALIAESPHPLLDPDSRATLLTDQTPDPDPRTGYAIGLHLTRVGDTLLASHSGRVAGYTSYLVFDPATGAGVVLLRNYNRGATNLAAEADRLVLSLGASRDTTAG